MMTDFSPSGLRVLREVAQAASFSAAAHSLGYSQSAVSRQVAALEAVAGRRLFDRSRHGVTLTPAGTRLLASAVRVLDELDAALREVAGDEVSPEHPLARQLSVELEILRVLPPRRDVLTAEQTLTDGTILAGRRGERHPARLTPGPSSRRAAKSSTRERGIG